MQLTPLIAIHMTSAALAVAVGPLALWARLRLRQRPRLHRAFGYAWVTLMLLTASTAIFIRDYHYPNVSGYTLIHLLVPATYGSLIAAFVALARGNVPMHRGFMIGLYAGACLIAGAFTLLPSRYLGSLLWG
jgi:uncharacterized membrane protein